MEKRYQVFVSSTFWDLEDARQEVMQALLEQDCMPSGMELFPATNEDQWSLIKKVIDDSDYYIVVLAGRYGSVGPSGQSYTEMEYRYALETGKPILGFIHRNIGELPAKFSETSAENKEKLTNFHELVKQKLCKFWETPAELGGHVSRSLIKLTKAYPATGWVRGDLIPSESAVEEILSLRRRIDELQQELAANHAAEPNISSDLAKGSDKFNLRYKVWYSEDRHGLVNNTIHDSVEVSWDNLFGIIAPYMIDEAPDEILIDALNRYFISYARTKIKEPIHKIRTFNIANDDYQTLKIQFRALGYIAKSAKSRSVKDTSTYWALTPIGDTVMTRLRAIKSPQKLDELI